MQFVGRRKGYTKIQLGGGEGEQKKNHGELKQPIEEAWHVWLEPCYKKKKNPGSNKLGEGRSTGACGPLLLFGELFYEFPLLLWGGLLELKHPHIFSTEAQLEGYSEGEHSENNPSDRGNVVAG